MGVLGPLLSPESPFKREGPLIKVAFTGALAVGLLCCVFMMALGGNLGAPSRMRVRLKLDTDTGKASWEAEGDEQQVQDMVAALDAAALDNVQHTPEVPTEGEVAQAAAALEAVSVSSDEATRKEEDAVEKRQQAHQEDEQQQREEQEKGEPSPTVFDAVAADGQDAEEDRFKDCDNSGQFSCLNRQSNWELGTSGGRRQFRFPHFYIAGFQKCATTSLYHHLIQHPQIEPPSNKEPEFFTKSCNYNAMRCSTSKQRGYIRDTLMFHRAQRVNFTKAAFEGSTHYGLEGQWLAMQLKEHFPWIKIVLTMREPISQAISMLNHELDHKRIPACYSRNNRLIFECINIDLDFESRYARSMHPWVKHIPRQQLHVLQYENLTSDSNMAPALRDLKGFLEIDPVQPSDDLGLFNFRHQRKGAHKEGWPMKRSQYEALVEKARRNAEEIVELVREQRFADADAWMANWEAAWKLNLEQRCKPGLEGSCMVLLT